jgi:hypothetical protein
MFKLIKVLTLAVLIGSGVSLPKGNAGSNKALRIAGHPAN